MDSIDEMGVTEEALANYGAAQAALDFLARHVRVREDADAFCPMRPLLRQDGQFRNDQCCLAASGAGGYVDRGTCGQEFPAWRIKGVQPLQVADPIDVFVRDLRDYRKCIRHYCLRSAQPAVGVAAGLITCAIASTM